MVYCAFIKFLSSAGAGRFTKWSQISVAGAGAVRRFEPRCGRGSGLKFREVQVRVRLTFRTAGVGMVKTRKLTTEVITITS